METKGLHANEDPRSVAAGDSLPNAIPRLYSRPTFVPMSYAQEGLWFLQQMDSIGGTYNLPLALSLKGALDVSAMERALSELVRRHETLRTRFMSIGGKAGQVIGEPWGVHLEVIDAPRCSDQSRWLDQWLEEEGNRPFRLEGEWPFRAHLAKLSEREHVLLLVMHHIVCDGWSLMEVLPNDLSALYKLSLEGKTPVMRELPIQCADFAIWQRELVTSSSMEHQREYWRAQLHDAPSEIDLRSDYVRPAIQSFRGDAVYFRLERDLVGALKVLGRDQRASLFMVLLAAAQVLLCRWSGQEDVLVGAPSAGRLFPELEGLVGHFVNTLLLRGRPNLDLTVHDYLRQTRLAVLDAYSNQQLPFEILIAEVQQRRTSALQPPIQVMFAMRNFPKTEFSLPGLEASRLNVRHVSAKFDLAFHLEEESGCITGEIEFSLDLFAMDTVRSMAESFLRLLRSMASNPNATLGRLPFISERQSNVVLEQWNNTKQVDGQPDRCVHELFEDQVRRRGDATALIYDDRSLSYAQLSEQANRLAGYLRGRGVEAGERIAILMPRSIELVIAEIAVLKCGAVYVPLDEEWPEERQRFLIRDSEARFLLGVAAAAPECEEGVEWINVIQALTGLSEEEEKGNLYESIEIDAEDAAYIMYTSGSTGEPKGVMVPHRAIVNLTVKNGHPRFEASDCIAFIANPAFDGATIDVWAALLNGGRLAIISKADVLEPRRLAATISRHGVTVILLVTSLFGRHVKAIAAELSRLRLVLVGGERTEAADFALLLQAGGSVEIINAYGPTEATTFATTYRVLNVSANEVNVPIGRPISNTRIYILDRYMCPVPIGAAGEIYIGGAGVALGYLGKPELTAERFLADPFSASAGARMYRTGDIGRWRADGNIEFLGRNDQQVKNHGYRIELAEIEAQLRRCEGVGEAAVLLREDAGREKHLVAYYTVGRGDPGSETLREHLQQQLPQYMLPAAYVRLLAMPLTPNGKLDRKALPMPERDSYMHREYEAPQGEIETLLAGIWQELLGVRRVGRQDDFFELGGNSLLAVQVVWRIEKMLGVEVGVQAVFRRSTLQGLAEAISEDKRPGMLPIEPADREERLPLSFAQQRLWFIAQLDKQASRAYHISFALRMNGKLDKQALSAALNRIVARHESLRTRFLFVDGMAVQCIDPPEIGFELSSMSCHGAITEEELRGLMGHRIDAAFDLEAGPLIRGCLIRVSDSEHVLLITMHHIVSDGWSMGVFFKELNILYAAYRRGEGDPLPPLSIQYADYAMWQRLWLEGERLQRQGEYWQQALSGIPQLLTLPTDKPRPKIQRYEGQGFAFELSEQLTSGLKELSRRHGATLFMTVLTGWAALLGRLSGQQDVVVGTPVTNRMRAETEGLIGFFVNTLAIRVDLSDSPNTGQLIDRVKSQALAAQSNQDIPFEKIVELLKPERTLAHGPLFQVMLAWQNLPDEYQFEMPDLRIEPVRLDMQTAQFDLALSMKEVGGRIEGSVTYATSLFERATIQRYLGYWRRLLEGMLGDEATLIDQIDILPQAEGEL